MRGRRGLHGTVVDELGSQIVSGAIPEGTVLVPDELCERYDVSRTVVRAVGAAERRHAGARQPRLERARP